MTRATRAIGLILLLAASFLRAEPDPPKPNVVLILADDLGYGDLGCYGQKRIKTPNLDRLAAEGVRFTQAYAGSTVCAPSRCVLMTGKHTGHATVRGNSATKTALGPGDATIAETLRQVGYATACIGKWGLGDAGTSGEPRKKGFDYFYGYLGHMHAHNYYPSYLWRNEERVPLKNVVPGENAQGAGRATVKAEYSADLFADEALAFIRRSKERPFFLYLAPTLPHANNEARDLAMEVPELGEYAALSWPASQKGHAAMITRLDRDVGRLAALLKELGLDERTLVIFTSDNGPHGEGGVDPEFNNSNGPLRGLKRDLYEGGIRVPFIARWPGRAPAGAVSEQPIAFWDLLPTLAELAGAKAIAGIDGISIAPSLLGGRQERQHEYYYWEFYERGFQQALRKGGWKLLKLSPRGPSELYDVKVDRGEERDVAAERPGVVKELEKILAEAHVSSPDWPDGSAENPGQSR